MGPREIILTTVVPGLIVGVALLVAWSVHARRKVDGVGPTWVAPIALSIGFAVAFWALNPPTRWWPVTGSERILHIGIVAMLAGVGCALLPKPWYAKHLISAISLALVVWIASESLPQQTLSRQALVTWIAAVAVAGTMSLAQMNDAASRTSAWFPSAQFIAIALTTSAISMFSSIALFAALAGSLVAMATASAVVGLIHRDFRLAPAGTLVMYTFSAVLIVYDALYAPEPLHLAAYVLVLCAPLGSVTARISIDRSRVRLSPTLLGMAGVLAPLIVAIIIGFITRDIPEPYDY